MELCEGCWEVGGRLGWLEPSSSSGMDSSLALGGTAAFRFRPFWSVLFALDHHPTRLVDGPHDSFTLVTAAFEYTFRAARDQRTRPFGYFALGAAREAIDADTASAPTSDPGSPESVQSHSSSVLDHSVVYGVGAGAVTSMGKRHWLRYEVRLLQWGTFGESQSAAELLVGMVFRTGG